MWERAQRQILLKTEKKKIIIPLESKKWTTNDSNLPALPSIAHTYGITAPFSIFSFSHFFLWEQFYYILRLSVHIQLIFFNVFSFSSPLFQCNDTRLSFRHQSSSFELILNTNTRQKKNSTHNFTRRIFFSRSGIFFHIYATNVCVFVRSQMIFA